MKKLLNGLLEYQEHLRYNYLSLFEKLRHGQMPDSLFLTCADSRLIPNLISATAPGDMFVVRNVGNLIPPADVHGITLSDESEPAAVEFALGVLGVNDIVVCGHSGCGAINSVMNGREKLTAPNLRSWLRHCEKARDLVNELSFGKDWSLNDKVSQANVLLQLEHLASYPLVQEKIQHKEVSMHGWWFDLNDAMVYLYIPTEKRFIPLNQENLKKLISE